MKLLAPRKFFKDTACIIDWCQHKRCFNFTWPFLRNW